MAVAKDLESLITRYKSDARYTLFPQERARCIQYLREIQQLFDEVQLPPGLLAIYLVGSFSRFDKKTRPQLTGEKPSDIDLLFVFELLANQNKIEDILHQMIHDSVQKLQLKQSPILKLYTLIFIRRYSLFFLYPYIAYSHMVRTATLLKGDPSLLSTLQVSQYRDQHHPKIVP